MLETIVLVLVTAFAGLIAFLVIYARWNFGTLEKLGIPVAKPHFILGSDPDAHKVVHQERDLERYRKYGPVFGVYEGRLPRVFVVDPDMIKHIMVKDFDHFYDRRKVEWGHEVFDNLLDFLPGEKWKTVRAALTPMFTSSRIRNGGKQFLEITEKYVKKLKVESQKDRIAISVKKYYMDLVNACKELMTPVFVEFTSEYFLAIKISGEGDITENYIYKLILESLGEGVDPSFMFTLLNTYPFILKLFPGVGFSQGIDKFLSTLEEVLKFRKASKKDTSSGKDFIDVMVSMLENLDSPEYKRLGIDKICVQSQAFEMFIAGYDSILETSTILSYYLASNPEIQEKVLEEVDAYFSKPEKERSSGDLSDLTYLTACVKEAIRLSPSFHRPERLCMKTWSYTNEEKGIKVTIPEGMNVVFPSWATNRNPEVFKDPETFKPERFTKEGEEGTDNLAQYANTSFGHGPRNCPGSRMGIEMIKAGIVTILKEFRFEMRDDTKVVIQEGIPMITRYKPIILDLVRRDSVIGSEQ